METNELPKNLKAKLLKILKDNAFCGVIIESNFGTVINEIAIMLKQK